MKLIINGEERELQSTIILDILQELNIEDKVMAAAVNMEVVKKDQWSTFEVKENDRLELLNFVGGG